MSGPIPEDEMKDAIHWLARRTVAADDYVRAMSDGELAQALLTGKWTTLEVHEAGRRLRRAARSQDSSEVPTGEGHPHTAGNPSSLTRETSDETSDQERES